MVRKSGIRKFLRRKADSPVASRICQLHGYRRCWNVAMDNSQDLPSYKFYIDPQTGKRPEVFVTFLNIRPVPGHAISGILFSVTEEELRMLDERERNYAREEVSTAISISVPGKVWVYKGTEAARERFVQSLSYDSACVQAGYYHDVHDAFQQLGAHHAQRFMDSTDAPKVPILDLWRVNTR